MKIINFGQNPIKSNPLDNQQPKNKVENSGEDNKKDVEMPASDFYIYVSPMLNDPMFVLNRQLLKDGFDKDKLKEADIFYNKKLRSETSFDTLSHKADKIVEYCETKENLTPTDILFEKTPKDNGDKLAMSRVYKELRNKYYTEDVKELDIKMKEIADNVNKILKKDINYVPHSQTDMLMILASTNKYNEPLTLTLLNDDDFDNTYIHHPLISMDTEEKANCAMKILEKAQEKGYPKEFSSALATILGEASETTLLASDKLLNEQETLIDNEDFVCSGLMGFLRGWEPEVLETYLDDDSFTLKDAIEVINMDEDSD